MGQRADEIVPHAEDGNNLWSAGPPASSTEMESSTSGPLTDDGEDEIDERLSEIERTRAEMSGTIDALQERLAPQHLVDQAREAARETTTNLVEDAKEALREGTIRKAEQIVNEVEDTARGMRTTLMDLVQENPVPAAVAGIGLGWLFMKSRSHSTPSMKGYPSRGYSDYGYSYRMRSGETERDLRSTVSQAQDRAEDMVDQARDAAGHIINDAGDLASDATERAARLASSAGSKAKGAGSTLWEAVAQNPLPAALAGLSMAWIYMRRDGMAASYPGASTVGELTDRASELTDRAKDQLEDLSGGAQFRAQQAQGQFERMLQESPLAVGAVALGLGAAIGLVVPGTSRERELMGEARETFMEKAQQAAQGAQQRIQEVGEQVQQVAKQELTGNQESQQKSSGTSSPSGSPSPSGNTSPSANTGASGSNRPSGNEASPYGQRLAS